MKIFFIFALLITVLIMHVLKRDLYSNHDIWDEMEGSICKTCTRNYSLPTTVQLHYTVFVQLSYL